jgi:hypothetical protein
MPACGYTCRCHGGYVCELPPHDDHGDHWCRPRTDHPVGCAGGDSLDCDHVWVYSEPSELAPPGRSCPRCQAYEQWHTESRVSHRGRDAQGQAVTWTGPCQTDEEIDRLAEEAAAGHAAQTRAFLEGLDQGVLHEFLKRPQTAG